MKTKTINVQFSVSEDVAAALDAYCEHDMRSRSNMVNSIVFSQLAASPTQLSLGFFHPENSLEIWVRDRMAGIFLDDWREALPDPFPSSRKVKISASLSEDRIEALEVYLEHLNFFEGSISKCVGAIVRSWLIQCPQNFELPRLPGGITLREWVEMSIVIEQAVGADD